MEHGRSIHVSVAMLAATTVGLLLSASALAADDAKRILERMRELQLERWEGVNSYYIDQTIMGNRNVSYFERDIVMDDDGNVVPYFRMVPFSELQKRQSEGQGFTSMSADDLDQMASAYRTTGDALGGEIEQGLEDAGLPRGLLAASGSDPNATFDPRVMMGSNADALEMMAEGQRQEDAARAAPENPMQNLDAMMEKATLVGKEKVEERSAWHIRIDDIGELSTQTDSNGNVVMHTSHMWIDTEKYVPLLFKMEGEMTAEDGQTRPVTMERMARDYRQVPDSQMYEPYESTMRMAGTLTPAQEAEMEKAQKQMADLEKQLASMPESQRSMIMQRMGPQLEMMRQMSSGGGMEFKTVVNEIKVNPTELPNVVSLPGMGDVGTAMPAMPAMPTSTTVPDAPPANTPAPAADQAALAEAQKTCLEEKMQAAQAAQQKKQGFGRLMGAVARTAGRFGNRDIGRVAGDVYSANATADDVATAAKELGVTQSDIDACRAPERSTD